MVMLGGASYAIYLLHTPLLSLWYSLSPAQLPAAIAFTSFGGVVCLIVVLSVLHYRWIEVPMLRLSRKPMRLVPIAAT